MSALKTLVVCGLLREGQLAAAPHVTIVASGGRRSALEARLTALDPTEFEAAISFGLAGALVPMLAVGDILVARALVDCALPHPEVLAEGEPRRTHSRSSSVEALPRRAPQDEEGGSLQPVLANHLSRIIAAAGLPFREGTFVGVDGPVATPAGKAELRARSGADAVDMESHVAGAFASRHGLPFGVLRVVSDDAHHTIPPAAIAAMRDDGGVDVPAVLKSLARDPQQLPALIRTARDGARAFRVLGRVGGLLRGGVGLHLR